MRNAFHLLPQNPSMIDQPIYWTRFGGKSLVDPLRIFRQARGYQWRGVAFPDTPRENFAARAQLEDQVSITPGSFLLMISAHCDNAFPNDFRFEVIDQGSNQTAFSNDWLRYMAATGGVRLSNEAARFGAGRGLPMILPSPFAVTQPGRLLIRMVNLATAAQNIRLFLQFAEPVGKQAQPVNSGATQ